MFHPRLFVYSRCTCTLNENKQKNVIFVRCLLLIEVKIPSCACWIAFYCSLSCASWMWIQLYFLRALKTRGNTPKYGLIFHSTFIGRAAAKNKGRISRYLANKCTIASRIDCFSGEWKDLCSNALCNTAPYLAYLQWCSYFSSTVFIPWVDVDS